MQRGERSNKKAQISIEHLFIVLMAVAILIPGTFLFFQFSKNSNHEMVSNQVVRIGDEILRTAETVRYLGSGSRMRMSLTIPKTVSTIRVSDDGQELEINYSSYAGKSSAVFFPEVTLVGGNGNDILPRFHTGRTALVFENYKDVVYIKEVT